MLFNAFQRIADEAGWRRGAKRVVLWKRSPVLSFDSVEVAGATASVSSLILRHWAPDDRRPFALMNSDPEVMRYILSFLSADQSDLYAETMQLGLEERDYGFWAVELALQRHAGTIYRLRRAFCSH